MSSLFPGEKETLESVVQRLAKTPLDFQPGARWRYSGLAGIDTLGRIVEVSSGQNFDEFLKRRIFEPLGMNDTFFDVPDDRKDRLATVYRGTENGLEKSTFTLRFPKGYYSARAGCRRVPPTTSASPRCSPTAASWAAIGCSARGPSS